MAETLVFQNAAILDCTGRDLYARGVLVVSGGRIQAVSTMDHITTPRDAQVIDLMGMTLMPGLIDAHTHMGLVDVDPAAVELYPGATYPLLVAQRLEGALMSGFTTVRDAGVTDWSFKLAVQRGLIKGPRMFVSNSWISQTGGHGDWRRRHDRSRPKPDHPIMPCPAVCDGVTQVRQAAREQLRTGADQLKIHAGGGVASPTDAIDVPQFTVEELAAAVYEARAVRKYVMAHVFVPEGIKNCAEAGVATIEHGVFLDEESADLMRQHNMYLVPTLSVMRMLYELAQEGKVPPHVAEKIGPVTAASLEAVRIAMDAGVAIGSGSDIFGVEVPNSAWELELKAQVMSPMASIMSATRTNSQLLGMEGEIGTLEVGKMADLIVVDGDPLADITVLKDEGRVKMVVQLGQVVKNTLG